MAVKLIFSLIIFSVFLTWIFTNPLSLQKQLFNFLTRRGLSITLIVILMLLQIWTPYLQVSLPDGIRLIKLIGVFIFVLGSILSVWAKLTMKENWGVPAEHNIDRQKILVTSGPFSLTRNPIYVGLTSMFIGFELYENSLLILLIIPLYYYVYISIRQEEKLLEKYFGREYLEYKKKIPRFF